jgi:hypothetical protein
MLDCHVAQDPVLLTALQIYYTGTTRKNAQDIPSWLIKLKEHNRGLVWNSAMAEIVEHTLCFLSQDNNAILGLTTAHFSKIIRLNDFEKDLLLYLLMLV